MSRWRLLVGVLCLSAGLAYGDIYQWVDDAGRVHYSDEAPDGVDPKTVTPNTERLGVQISKPQDSEAWSDRVLNSPSTGATGSASQASRRQKSDPFNDWETDLCDGVVGDCFTEQQDYVCKLRFGLECKEVYHWKVCLHQDCNDKKISDKCDSPYHLLDRRPAVLTQRDMGRPMPLKQLVSDRDWQCLSLHGFFCDELAFEATCQQRYGQSCEMLESWVNAAQKRCKKQRGSDCDRVDGWKQFRPVSLEETKKAGARLPNGGVASRDFLLESLAVEKDDPAHYPQMQKALESLTGLNIRQRRRSYDCNASWKTY